jgi:DNA topoisomerase-1
MTKKQWKGLRYQKWRLKHMMLDIDPKAKKSRGAAFFALDEDITSEWILEHQASLVEAQRQQITKKFQKENEKLVEEGKKPMPDKELKERLKPADELQSKFNKENKTKKVLAEGKSPSIEKLEAAISKCEARIKEAYTNMTMKDSNKEISLGTSKIVRFSSFFYFIFILFCLFVALTESDRTTSTRD